MFRKKYIKGLCVCKNNAIFQTVRFILQRNEVCEIKEFVLAPSWFNSFAPELVVMFYSAIKHGYTHQ